MNPTSTPPLTTPDPGPDATAGSASWATKGSYLLLSLAVLALDQWSKWMVDAHLPPHTVEEIIPGALNFIHVKNTGVAFGFLADMGQGDGTWLLVGMSALALVLVLFYFWTVPRDHRLLQASLGLILGGAVGNLIDRVAAGAVTDFIDFYVGTYHWHTFNVADIAITVGIALVALDTLLAHRQQRAADGADSVPAA